MADQTDNPPIQEPGEPATRLDRLTPGQQAVHRNFLSAHDGLKQNLLRMIFYLRAVVDGRIHNLLGYARITDYAQHYAGLSPRQTHEFLVLGKRLTRLPKIAAALERGDLSWSRAREIVRLVRPEDQQQWIDVARSVSRQELRDRVKRGAPEPVGPGRSACAPTRSAVPVPATPRCEVAGNSPTCAGPAVGRASAAPVTCAPTIQAMPPRTIVPEQHLRIKMTAEQYARWEALLESLRKQQPGLTPAQAMLATMADAQSGDGLHGGRSPYLIVLIACPMCGAARIPTSRGEAEADGSLLAAAHCDAVIEHPGGARRQVIMPRLRRQALQRARYACEAQGCNHTRFLEIHHRVPVASGGRTELDNLIVLCSRCHRLLHRQESARHHQRRQIEDIAHDWSHNRENDKKQ